MILAFMQFPPNHDGYGGSQRSWHLSQALAKLGPVHFVFLHPTRDSRFDDFDPAILSGIAASVTVIPVPEWDKSHHFFRPRRYSGLADYARMGTPDAPTLSKSALEKIAVQLPIKDVDTVFAFRVPMGTIANGLLKADLINAKTKILDLDDIVSIFRQGEQASNKDVQPLRKKLAYNLQLKALQNAEQKLAQTWDAVSLCSDDDVKTVQESAGPKATVFKVPNVIDRDPLPSSYSETFRILFVGNLNFRPNVQGLTRFLDEAWPLIKGGARQPELTVVGLNPSGGLTEKIRAAGANLHANVPSVVPFYADADVVIAPIFFGSGTRIKIIEALAFERAVVSTPLGAEGLDLDSGREAFIIDDMRGFAAIIMMLAGNADLRLSIAKAGRELQQERFGPAAMERAVREMFVAAAAR